jgi:hypothetical protein
MIRKPPLGSSALGCILLSACGGAARSGEHPVVHIEDAKGDVERYMPLEDRTVYTYDTHSENQNATGLLIVQISRPRPGRADLHMGSRIERLEIHPDAIAFVEGGFLLKLPLVVGASWRSKSGTVSVVAADEDVTVPAGSFTGCVRTREEERTPTASKAVTSVYCPHVGLVSVDAEGVSDTEHDRETAILKSFGPRVDLTSEDVTTTTDD